MGDRLQRKVTKPQNPPAEWGLVFDRKRVPPCGWGKTTVRVYARVQIRTGYIINRYSRLSRRRSSKNIFTQGISCGILYYKCLHTAWGYGARFRVAKPVCNAVAICFHKDRGTGWQICLCNTQAVSRVPYYDVIKTTTNLNKGK